MNTDSDRIRDALAGQRDHDLADIEWQDEGVFKAMAASFKGPRKKWTIFCFIIMHVYSALAITCIVRFFQVDAVKSQIMYAAGFTVFILAVAAIKLWYCMEMNKHSLAREIKRLELQVARLAEKLDGGK